MEQKKKFSKKIFGFSAILLVVTAIIMIIIKGINYVQPPRFWEIHDTQFELLIVKNDRYADWNSQELNVGFKLRVTEANKRNWGSEFVGAQKLIIELENSKTIEFVYEEECIWKQTKTFECETVNMDLIKIYDENAIDVKDLVISADQLGEWVPDESDFLTGDITIGVKNFTLVNNSGGIHRIYGLDGKKSSYTITYGDITKVISYDEEPLFIETNISNTDLEQVILDKIQKLGVYDILIDDQVDIEWTHPDNDFDITQTGRTQLLHATITDYLGKKKLIRVPLQTFVIDTNNNMDANFIKFEMNSNSEYEITCDVDKIRDDYTWEKLYFPSFVTLNDGTNVNVDRIKESGCAGITFNENIKEVEFGRNLKIAPKSFRYAKRMGSEFVNLIFNENTIVTGVDVNNNRHFQNSSFLAPTDGVTKRAIWGKFTFKNDYIITNTTRIALNYSQNNFNLLFASGQYFDYYHTSLVEIEKSNDERTYIGKSAGNVGIWPDGGMIRNFYPRIMKPQFLGRLYDDFYDANNPDVDYYFE